MDEATSIVDDYLDAFLETNKLINLTNITERDQANLLHVEDSLAALPEVEAALPGRYGDMGSGGGFPGVPIGIMSGRETLLIDSVKKKMRAVQAILEELGLDETIGTYDGRIEELAEQQPRSFSVLTARALSSLPSLLELASPLLVEGGRLICYKAHVSDEELSAARHVARQVAMRCVGKRSFTLSDGQTARTILVFEKHGKPQIKLPRRVGMAQRHPLNE